MTRVVDPQYERSESCSPQIAVSGCENACNDKTTKRCTSCAITPLTTHTHTFVLTGLKELQTRENKDAVVYPLPHAILPLPSLSVCI